MNIIQKRKYLFVFSGLLVLASVVLFAIWGLKLGIDFTGGSLLELGFKDKTPSNAEVTKALEPLGLGSLSVQTSQEGKVFLRYIAEEDSVNSEVQKTVKEKFPDASIDKLEFVNSSISGELKQKAIYALVLAVVGIAAYIAWAFKGVSYPVESWKYGVAAVVALMHDIVITVGFFVVFGKFWGIEVNIPFIAALLTILGYSVNDTIVVFDRVRENIVRIGAKDDFENTVNKSINETLARSINTSLTVILVLVALVLLGGASIKYFALALLIGVLYGTYSSIFVASAILVEVWKRQRKLVLS